MAYSAILDPVSQLDTVKPVPVSLSQGFSWYAVLSITRPRLGRRQILYDMKLISQPGRLSIGLDHQGRLRAWLNDVSGRGTETTPVRTPPLAQPFVLMFRITPTGRRGARTLLRVNDESPISDEFPWFKHWKDGTLASTRVGGSFDEGEDASFILSELMIYSRSHDPATQARIWKYARDRYALR